MTIPPRPGLASFFCCFSLIAMNFLKGSSTLADSGRRLSGDKVFAQVSGDIRFPGVYRVRWPTLSKRVGESCQGINSDRQNRSVSCGVPIQFGFLY